MNRMHHFGGCEGAGLVMDYGLWTTIGYDHSISHMYSTQYTIHYILYLNYF